MASHFRSTERQGSEGEPLDFVSVPDEASQATPASPEDTGAFLAAGGVSQGQGGRQRQAFSGRSPGGG